jgi:hypothetical protein
MHETTRRAHRQDNGRPSFGGSRVQTTAFILPVAAQTKPPNGNFLRTRWNRTGYSATTNTMSARAARERSE